MISWWWLPIVLIVGREFEVGSLKTVPWWWLLVAFVGGCAFENVYIRRHVRLVRGTFSSKD
jgi:uncharacterized membrane protein YbhN (UPF0104 family)